MKTNLGYMLRDITDLSDATFTYMAQQCQDYLYRNLVKVDPEKFISEQSYSVTSGTNNYALPSDFMHIQPDGCGLYEKSTGGYEQDLRWLYTQYGDSTQGYYIEGSNIRLTPDPNKSTKTLVLRYIPNTTRFTATTDYFTTDATASGVEVCPDEFADYLTKAIQVYYYEWDQDAANESIADFRYVRILNDLLDNIKRSPAVYIQPDLSSPF